MVAPVHFFELSLMRTLTKATCRAEAFGMREYENEQVEFRQTRLRFYGSSATG